MSQSPPPTGSPPPGSTQFDPDAELDAGLDADAGAEDSVQRELADLEQQVAAAREEVLRTRADMDNTRKRLSRELETVRRYAAERVLADLLPVIDSLDQGLTALPQDDPGREGLDLTRRQLLTAMERHGLVILDPQGEAFDPAEHQAISTQASDSAAENTILTVLQKGFRLHERVLRPAMVIVAQGAADA